MRSCLKVCVASPKCQTSFLKVYTAYINNFDNAIATLAKLKQVNENFAAFISVPVPIIAQHHCRHLLMSVHDYSMLRAEKNAAAYFSILF